MNSAEQHERRNGTFPNALILDFGGVISKTLFETHALTERALGLPPGSLTWQGPFDPAGDPLWRDMQMDRITERDYWLQRAREVGGLLGENWNAMADFVRRARGDHPKDVLRPEMQDVIDSCQSNGIALAILSNELDLFYGKDFRRKLDFLDKFDCIEDATYTGVLKPNREAYVRCLRALGMQAEDCLFVDDQERNIKGAEAAGLRTVHFDVTRPADSCDSIRQRLGIRSGLRTR